MSLQWDIQVHEKIDSTQDLIKDSRRSEGLVIHALEQAAGRGRHGRVWEAPRGNLYISLILKPQSDVKLMGQISLLIGLAVHKTASAFIGAHAQALMLKWPNDVLLDGRKCAGILMESNVSSHGEVDELYIGIGVNLAHAPLDIASALNDYTEAPIDVSAFRDRLLDNIAVLYGRWLEGDAQAMLHEWEDAAHKVDSPLSVKLGSNIQNGHFHGIDEFGSLILSLGENQFKTITAGEIFLSAED